MGADSLLVMLAMLTGQIDARNIIAHADTVRLQTGVYFPDAAALAISWKETRSGLSKNSARGPGIWKHRTLRQPCSRVLCLAADSVKVCKEIGRFQLSPCQDYTHIDPRCTRQNITNSYDDNIHCGLMWLAEKIKACQGDIACGLERYNGNGCITITDKPLCSNEYRKEALAYIGDLYLKGWAEIQSKPVKPKRNWLQRLFLN